jgi:DNA-directed RNA polymerase specialized sigma24 family protein
MQKAQLAYAAEYATAADFCKIFNQDMNSLYLLSLLLTGDHANAEQCFVSALEVATNRKTVFKEWARSWARRAVIQEAILMIDPRPKQNAESWNGIAAAPDEQPAERSEIAAVLTLTPFERFVFVMTVLERFSNHDCAILLGCAAGEVREARIRALTQIGSAMESLSPEAITLAGRPDPNAFDTEWKTYAKSA